MIKFPYQAETRHSWDIVVPWCEEHIGKYDRDWFRYGTDIAAAVYDPDYKETYYFAKEKDCMWFMLRWS